MEIGYNHKHMDKQPQRQPLDFKKYLLAFFITAVIFGLGMYINAALDERRFGDIQSIQNQISLDLLSSETQFSLLRESSCKNVDDSVLSNELNSLANKLSYLESNNGSDAEVAYLKRYYSLLEIKDFLLMKQLNAKCASKPIAVIYFYGNKDDCPECEKMSFVLTYLREQYPELRIYSFDSNLSLSAVDTLKSIYKVDSRKLPAIIIGDESYTGFRDIEEMKTLIPELKKIDAARIASSTASTSAATSSNR